jgi:hypothetical protein
MRTIALPQRSPPGRVADCSERNAFEGTVGLREVDQTTPDVARLGALAEKLPDFFIVGHPKCGTTALYEMLKPHPEIFMPDVKEPWYFATELHERTPPRPQGIAGNLEEYLELFADALPGQHIGEASPHYLWSHTAAQKIAEVRPDAKIIAILREPASFLRSLHLQFVEVYYETEADLRTALELEGERREGRSLPRYGYWPQMLIYSEHVRYVEQLKRYHEAFGRDQVLVLIYDDFRTDNEETVRRVERFLGVDDTAAVRRRRGQSDRPGALAGAQRGGPRRGGRPGSDLPCAEGVDQGGHSRRAAAKGPLCAAAERRLRKAEAGRRATDGGAAQSLPGRGRSRIGVPRTRPDRPVGL